MCAIPHVSIIETKKAVHTSILPVWTANYYSLLQLMVYVLNQILEIILAFFSSFPFAEVIQHNASFVAFSSLLPPATTIKNIAAVSTTARNATPINILYDDNWQIEIILPRHRLSLQRNCNVFIQRSRQDHHQNLHRLPAYKRTVAQMLSTVFRLHLVKWPFLVFPRHLEQVV